MSEEKKKSGFLGFVKGIGSAIIGAAISFATTFGIMSQEQEKVVNERLDNINVKAEQVIDSLKNKDIETAMKAAQEIVADTTVVVDTGKVVAEQAKEKADTLPDELKKKAEVTKEDIKAAVEKAKAKTDATIKK